MSTSNSDSLAKYTLRLALLKDRVTALVTGDATGLYLYGRAGSSKTHTVQKTLLEALGAKYVYVPGHLTAIGLYELIAKNPDKIIVLDDVAKLFGDKLAMQILFAALGNQPNGRKIRYTTKFEDKFAVFTGAIVMISNLPLKGHSPEILEAFQSRVNVIHFDVTDEEMAAIIREIASNGIGGVSPAICMAIAEFVIAEAIREGVPLSIRLFVDKAMGDYRFWKKGKSNLHWKDLIRSSIKETLVELQEPMRRPSKIEEIEKERKIVCEICKLYSEIRDRLRAWTDSTGKSRAAFYRRLGELN